jgi:hypothetical protein
MFKNVRVLRLVEYFRSFEHDYFARISCSFPFLSSLTVWNFIGQKQKSSHQQPVKPEEISSIIEYSHLVELDFVNSLHIDYVEQFLSNLNTRLPCLSKLHIRYEYLVTVTENFTRNATRINCEKLKQLRFYYKVAAMVHSKDYYDYFPSLEIMCSR